MLWKKMEEAAKKLGAGQRNKGRRPPRRRTAPGVMKKMEEAAKNLGAGQRNQGRRPPRRRTAPGVMLYQLNQIQQCIFFLVWGGLLPRSPPPRKSATALKPNPKISRTH